MENVEALPDDFVSQKAMNFLAADVPGTDDAFRRKSDDRIVDDGVDPSLGPVVRHGWTGLRAVWCSVVVGFRMIHAIRS
ncbi:hypothetical protein QF001_003867 [Paraburkholderia youngii]|uniref:hypothetical protein n=1 Tax=Paraburkholderia youngii TaxID=2782701 RepID=UPI003D1EB09B